MDDRERTRRQLALETKRRQKLFEEKAKRRQMEEEKPREIPKEGVEKRFRAEGQEEPEKKPKVLVRTASGAVISCNQTVGAPARRARRRAASVSQSQQTHPRVLARRRFRRALRAQSARWTMPSVWAWPSRPARFTLDEVR